MSRTRLVIRVLLGLLLVAMGWFIVRAQMRTSPERQVRRAEQALESGEWDAARIHLLNALEENQDNAAAHRLMGEVLLAEAKSNGEPATYQTNFQARQHLSSAGRLLPDDIELQKQLLTIFLDRGSLGAAAEIAGQIEAKEPNNPEVLVARLAKAVSSENAELAQQLLARLKEHPTARVFRAASLATMVFGRDSHPQPRAEVLAAAVEHASGLSSDELINLPLAEQLLMVELLKRAIQEAESANLAQQRAAVALDVCEKISGSGQQVPTELAGFAADVVATLRSNQSPTPPDANARQQRAEIIARAGKYLDQAIEEKRASFAVYLEAANIAFDRQEHEKVAEILSTALAEPAGKASEAVEQDEQKMHLHLLAARNLFVMRRYQDAKPHLQTLTASGKREYAGWGQLLSGGVASAEGRHETALEHYLQAQRLLGRTPFVEIALAKTYVVLGRWKDAQPLLERAASFAGSTDPSQQAWTRLHEMFQQQILWEQLRAHLALDEWEQAEEVAARFRGTPQAAEAEALTAGYLAAHGKDEAALERVVAVRATFPDDLRLRLTHARLLVQAGQSDAARALIEELADKDDLSSQAFLALWRMQEKKYDEAVQILSALETRFPNNPTPSYLKARVLLAAGKSREALAIAKELRESPETATAGSMLEILQDLRGQNLAEASERMKSLTEDAPSVSPGMSLFSGRLSAAQGDFATAVKQVGDSLDVTGLRQQARYTLLESLLQLADQEGPQKASESLAPLLAQYPDDAFLRVMEADLNFKQGKFDAGMTSLDQVERLVGRKPMPTYLKAAVWMQAGQPDRALEEVRRCLAIDPEYLPAHAQAAKLFLATGKYQRAAHHAATVLKRDPRQWDLYLVSAESLAQLGNSVEAMRLLASAIKVDPQFLAAYRGLASLQLAAGRSADALATCRQARQALPDSFVPITDEISIHCQQKQLAAAKSLATESAEEPQEVGKCLAISRTFAAAGQLDTARAWAQKSADLADDAEKPHAFRQLGELALWEGQQSGDRQKLESARDFFAKVVKANPHDFVAGNNLAWLLATEFDQPQEALEIVRQVQGEATADQMPVGFLDTLAVVYRRAGKLDEARELLDDALKSNPDNPMLMYHMGMILADRGQKSAALNMLERAVDIGGLPEAQQNDAKQTLQALTGSPPIPPN